MNYHDITKGDMKNGPGLRVVLWLSGCDHYCKGCHNPITWDPDDGLPFTDKERDEIFEELGKDYISGITFSGGDPLYYTNRVEVRELIEDIKYKFPNKTIWLYTGFKWEDLLFEDIAVGNIAGTIHRILQAVDVIIDGKFEEDKKDINYKWAGSTNQRVIDVKKSLEKGKVVLYEGN